MIVVAAIAEIEAEQQVECLAIKRTDRKGIRSDVQRIPMLIDNVLQRFGIHLP